MQNCKPRLLILGGKYTNTTFVAQALTPYFQVDTFGSTEEAMAALRRESYHVVLSDVGDFLPLERDLVGQKASLVLNTIGEGANEVLKAFIAVVEKRSYSRITFAISEEHET